MKLLDNFTRDIAQAEFLFDSSVSDYLAGRGNVLRSKAIEMRRKAVATASVAIGIGLFSLLPVKEGRAQDFFNARLRLAPGRDTASFALSRNEFSASGKIMAEVDTASANPGMRVSHTELGIPVIHYWKAGWEDSSTVMGLLGSARDTATLKGMIWHFKKDTLVFSAADTMSKNRTFVFVNGKPLTAVYGNDSLATKDSTRFSNYTMRMDSVVSGHDDAKDLFYTRGSLVFVADYRPPVRIYTTAVPPADSVLELAPGIGILAIGVVPDVNIDIRVVESATIRLAGSARDTTLPASMRIRASYGDASSYRTMGTRDLGVDRYVFANDFVYQMKPVGTYGNYKTKVYYNARGTTVLDGSAAWPAGDSTYHAAEMGINMYARPPADGMSSIYFDFSWSYLDEMSAFRMEDHSQKFDIMRFPDGNTNHIPWALENGMFRVYEYSGGKTIFDGSFKDSKDSNGFRMVWDTPTHATITRGAMKMNVGSSALHYPTARPTHKWVKPSDVVANGWTPREFGMGEYPNPLAGGRGMLRVELDRPGHLRIQIFDLLGRAVGEVADGYYPSGAYRLPVDLSGLPAGAYFVGERNGPKIGISRP